MLRMTPGIKKISVLKDQETTKLLESWMPAEAFKNINIPALIEIEFMEISNVNRLATRINNIAPGSLLDDHNELEDQIICSDKYSRKCWVDNFQFGDNSISCIGYFCGRYESCCK